jgi:cysteine desulfurase/selenocysteine lyase
VTTDPDAVLTELACWQAAVRDQFPILADAPGSYLDSAATSQKPRAVLDAVQHYLTTGNANSGRGSYPWAGRTTAMVDRCRERVTTFLDDPDPHRSVVQVVSGTTSALRTLALDWLADSLTDGDEIVVPVADHGANVHPWREVRDVLARRGTRIDVLPMPYEPSGDYDVTALAGLVSPRTRFVAVTHVHHVFGADMNVHRIREVVGPRTVVCLDAAQSVGHMPVSLSRLDVDFVAFSGHKAMALPGIGVLWARNVRGERYEPRGWDGSPNTTGLVSLEAALTWLEETGLERIARWTVALGARLTAALDTLGSYEVLGCQNSLSAGSAVQRRQGIVTFRHRGIPAADLGFVLSEHGFMVRANSLCQAGADAREESVRVSLHAYNTVEEIDGLIELLAALDEAAV